MSIGTFFKNLFRGFFHKDDSVTTSTTTDTTTTTTKSSARKKAICIGINDYRGTGNDLKGCVNDARNWAKLLKETFGFYIEKLILDNGAKKKLVVKAFKDLLADAVSGDVRVITYSGHGTTVRDKNGDEADGRDEAWCLYDGNLIDDDIKAIIAKAPAGVRLTILSDSCHSGTITRAFMGTLDNEEYSKPRYMPPKDDVDAFAMSELPLKKSVFAPRNEMKELLISGCKSTEYSYDAKIGGKPTGAFSYYAIEILKKNPKITYEKFHKLLRKKLPSTQYPQMPQLEGSEANKKSIMFE